MKRIFVFAFAALVCSVFSPAVEAGEMDVLLNKLIEKKILTPAEAETIQAETKKQIASGKHNVLPAWIETVKLKGDLRLRYQWEERDSNDHGRNRGRLRYRLGVTGKPADKVEVGAGLASGGSDPRSTNQTFQDTFSSKDIKLDYAYAKWGLTDWLTVVGGKFLLKDGLWQPTDLLWDTDINPEGAHLVVKRSLAEGVEGFLSTGAWMIDENGNSGDTDPVLHVTQAGVTYKNGGVDAKAAGTYYQFHGIQGVTLDHSAGSNSTLPGGGLMYDFDSIQGSAEIGVAKPFGGLPLSIDERIAVFGDYIHNFDPNDNETGWAVGVKLGNKKASNPGEWQAKYIYARLEKDAFPDTFPDSDRYGGRTDIKGHEVAFEYVLKKNVSLGLDYYHTERIEAASNAEDLFQADVSFKF